MLQTFDIKWVKKNARYVFLLIVSLSLMISQMVSAQNLPQPVLAPPISGPIGNSSTTTVLAQSPTTPTVTSAAKQADSQQAIVKVEESVLTVTPENEAAKKIVVSKIYDAQESAGNSYIVRIDGSDKAVVIDPGYNYEAIIKYLKQINVNVEAILLTNGYFARIAGNEPLRKEWAKATILIGEKDAALLTDTKANGSDKYGGVTSPNANVWLKDDDAFTLAGIPFHVLATPGHTAGSMSYAIAADKNAVIFTGDFAYKDGVSNAALPTSSEDDLNKSLETFLKTQYAETVILPGYGANTTVAAFYEQLTGKSVSVLKAENEQEKQSPVIIVERDPGVVSAPAAVVVAPMEYTTREIIIENYRRPWVSVGVVLPIWSSWYRPWHYYHDNRFHIDIVPPIFFSPFYRTPFHGSYYPQLVPPPRPGFFVPPPTFRPPTWTPPRPEFGRTERPEFGRTERPDFGRPPVSTGPNDKPSFVRPDARTNPPANAGRPDSRTNPPQQRPDTRRQEDNRPSGRGGSRPGGRDRSSIFFRQSNSVASSFNSSNSPSAARAAAASPNVSRAVTPSPNTTRATTSSPNVSRAVTSPPSTTRSTTSSPSAARTAVSSPNALRAVTVSPPAPSIVPPTKLPTPTLTPAPATRLASRPVTPPAITQPLAITPPSATTKSTAITQASASQPMPRSATRSTTAAASRSAATTSPKPAASTSPKPAATPSRSSSTASSRPSISFSRSSRSESSATSETRNSERRIFGGSLSERRRDR